MKDAGYNGVIIYNARLTQLNVPELNCECANIWLALCLRCVKDHLAARLRRIGPTNSETKSSSHSPQVELVVDFPVLLVTHIDGRHIKTLYTYDRDYFVYVFNDTPLINREFLLPFLIVCALSSVLTAFSLTGCARNQISSNRKFFSPSLSLPGSEKVIGACIIVIISFMISQIIRCYNERKKRRRHRLAKRHLKKIPTINFKKGDHYEICAICLDEFQEGVKLRLLTCRCYLSACHFCC